MKTYFITGGAGFIANTLMQRLVDDNRIVVYDNFSRDTLSPLHNAMSEQVNIYAHTCT